MLGAAKNLSLSPLYPTACLTLQMEEIYLKGSIGVRPTTVQNFTGSVIIIRYSCRYFLI